jgi:hypothetical protein
MIFFPQIGNAKSTLGSVQRGQVKIADAEAKNDTKAVEALSQKAQAQLDTLGSDYAKLLDAFDQTGPDSQEGKKISAALDRLDKQCR